MTTSSLPAAAPAVAASLAVLARMASPAAAATVYFDPSALRFSCVNPADGSTLPNGIPTPLSSINTAYEDVTVLLDPLPAAADGGGDMCVLHRWTSSSEDKADGLGYYQPLGRSVDGVPSEYAESNATSAENDWNRPPGKSSNELSYLCGTAGNSGERFGSGEYLCEVTLPRTSEANDEDPTITDYLDLPYYLTYYAPASSPASGPASSLAVRNELSRFLGKNTFGPTARELDALQAVYDEELTATATADSAGNRLEAMRSLQVAWVQNQTSLWENPDSRSSLRAYWRRRLNPRKEETYRIGESGPHPCDRHSRWRKFAFTNFDVQNSKMLRWGNADLGGSYQTQRGHRVTVEPVYLPEVPTTNSPVMAPLTIQDTGRPTTTAAPTSVSILAVGNMEAPPRSVLAQWPGRCSRAVVSRFNNTENEALVFAGNQSLHVSGPKRCFVFRPVGPACGYGRVTDPIRAGDVLRISAWVRTQAPGVVFQMQTGHYHANKGSKRWGLPADDSHMISRTRIPEPGVWTKIEATHKVGDDWTFRGQILTPARCNHYHLRFRTDEPASYYLDEVRIEKVDDGGAWEAHKASNSFFSNGDFKYDSAYWKYAPNAGVVEYDYTRDGNVMVLNRNKVLRQNVLLKIVPAETYQFSFWMKLSNLRAVDIRIIMRMKFTNYDQHDGLCPPRKVCNFFKRPLATRIEGNGLWQQVITDEFSMWDVATDDWESKGKIDFVLFQMFTRGMKAKGEMRIANLQVVGEDHTHPPSISAMPSQAPSNMVREDAGYVVRYAGSVRTVVRHPFQVDKTGEILAMDGSREYQLCEVDEVEGRKVDFPNRMNFFLNGRCQQIRGGNPTVDLNTTFLSLAGLHILDLSNSTSVVPINSAQTAGGDWLLTAPVSDSICSTFPNPYDNDYRGADEINPDDVPTRFEPDEPVFAKLPDGSYALYDSRLILHENTIESPAMDGGGHSVLRSTLRAQRKGLETKKYPWNEEYYVFNDHNIALCANEQPNFLNFDSCRLSYEENVCVKEYSVANVDVALVVHFDNATLASLHNLTLASKREADAAANVTAFDNSRYIYAVDGLRYDATNTDGTVPILPCMGEDPTSRWAPRSDLLEGECASSASGDIGEKTEAAFRRALETSNDENPLFRDVYLWNGHADDGCDAADELAYGMLIWTKEGCWENVHPDFMSIFDFTKYVSEHPANITNDTSITQFADVGILHYPESHPMSYFEELKSGDVLTYVERMTYATTLRVNQGARFGDKMPVDPFADQLSLNYDPIVLKELAEKLGVMTLRNQVQNNRGGGALVCGSPNEIKPDPFLDDYFDVIHRDLACIGCQDSYGNYAAQKSTVWAMNVLEGEDQLCQRMAWSLYELLNVGSASNPDNTESNLYAYDILNRHCFGSFFDVLKEMTFSPKTGEQFSYAYSFSARLAWDTSGDLVFPDENYGREIMQLFTIGLHELNEDGSEILDEFGRPSQTYDNFDIMSNARIFTGFEFTARRGNIEELFRAHRSRLDPMRINIDKHDFFPKSTVDGNWIGDRLPLCVDLPKHHFLKMGATYRFRAGSTRPVVHHQPEHWDTDESVRRFALSPESDLYAALCNPDGEGSCNFSNTVTLDSNLPCFGRECRVDDLVVVQVIPGAFYEYIRQPCVELSFYDNPKKVVTGFAPWVKWVGRRHTHAMCADPRTAVAARSCCNIEEASRSQYNYNFEYHGERTVLETNKAQCELDGGTVCDPDSMIADNPVVNIRPVYSFPYPSTNTFFWTDSNCTQQVKVRSDGMVAIIHRPDENPFFHDDVVPFVDLVNSVSFIGFQWQKDNLTLESIYPKLDNNCGNGACSITADDSCLCDVSIHESAVFDALPARDDVLSTLKIGGFDPATFADSDVTYSMQDSTAAVQAFVSSDAAIIGSMKTIFKVIDEYGDTIYLKNMKSEIKLGLGGEYKLRNPPSFINLVKPELRDAEYEVDAFLVQLIRHPSAAPFIAKKLIQYSGVSNPTPGFVRRVARSFISGSFTKRGVTFGDGKRGNLKAVAAAISLDEEALIPVIDEDPVNGNIREPLLKVIQFMRSLDFQRRPNVKFRHGLFDDMSHKIGQMVFDPPDQFSFFQSDFAPPGVFGESGTVSPEAQLLSMSSVVGITNGFFSFVNFGLANADGGFGPSLDRLPPVGDYSTSMGTLAFPYEAGNHTDVAMKVDELSTMMTAGRLSAENKQVLVDAHAFFTQTHGFEFADRALLKLLTTTPEFHTSNTLRKSGSPRSITPPAPKSVAPYKAIVYINLVGGADSFNILTPHDDSGCYLYDEYFEARGGRGGIGLKTSEVLPIDGSSAGISGCNTFGVNSLLPAFKNIYNEGKGIFFANMGHLHKPVTKENWQTETRTDLFSHHMMKKESLHVDAFREGAGPGVLGRLLDVVERQGHSVGATAINARSPMVDGAPSTGRLADVMSTEILPRVFDRNFLRPGESQDLRPYLEEIHAESLDNSGVFGNLWSQTFMDVWNKTDELVAMLRVTDLATPFLEPETNNVDSITSQLKLVAKLISIRNDRGNGINRDVFYCEMGGYDAHFELDTIMENKLPSLNFAVKSFWEEITAQGMVNNVVVIQGSEFGRTITANSNKGSDHGWGGNYFMFGGDVKGGKILGEYPKSFASSDPTNIGRGRLIPTTSWDALWYGVTQWFLPDSSDQTDIDYVLPNSQNFGCKLFSDYDLFNTGTHTISGCGGPVYEAEVTLVVDKVRGLTGKEQKKICKLAVKSSGKHLGVGRSKARCFIGRQNIRPSLLVPGKFEVEGIAELNFDASIQTEKVDKKKARAIGKAAATTAADHIVRGAVPISEAPSAMPSSQPTISSEPSSRPTMSASPTAMPSASPTASPSISSQPTPVPTLSSMPTGAPSSLPTLTLPPSMVPTVSIRPTLSFEPTPAPTARKVFQEDFHSRDIGYVGFTGQSYEAESGLYFVQGSGIDIWSSSDSYHYMHLETSGDITFTALIEGFSATDPWAKGGIMIRESLSEYSTHYSIFLTAGHGMANQYRTCSGCLSHHFQTTSYSPQQVWFRVTKVGNVLKSFYRPTWSPHWYQFGVMLSIQSISSNGYYIGVAATSRNNSAVATLEVSNIQLSRNCSSETITELQCDQATNCEWGGASGVCYNMSEKPEWEYGSPAASIFDKEATVTSFGCTDSATDHRQLGHGNLATDGTTDKFDCQKDGSPTTGLVISPFHGRLSIAKGLRVYAANNCFSCDPVSYRFEGRTDAGADWVLIKEGDLPWKSESNGGNSVLGLDISSTYSNGDPNHFYTEVLFDNVSYFMEYRVTWTDIRNSNSNKYQFAEIEVPGLLEEERSMAALAYAGEYSSSILDSSSGISYFGSFHVNNDLHQLVDRTTNKINLNRENHLGGIPGIVVTPTHGKMSVVTGMRIYTANNNPDADPVKYAIEGRYESGSRVQDRMQDRCWELIPESGNKIVPTASCDDANPNQRFYFTAENEIRVNGVPGYCLNMRLDGVETVYFHPCHDGENQKWEIDSVTEEIRSMQNNACLDYDTSTGYVWFNGCHGGSNQKFYNNESFNSSLVTAWTDITEGHLPWISDYDRNPLGLGIFSTYESGDDDHYFMEVTFYDNNSTYMDYRISFPELRDPHSLSLQFAEIELPGLIVNPEQL